MRTIWKTSKKEDNEEYHKKEDNLEYHKKGINLEYHKLVGNLKDHKKDSIFENQSESEQLGKPVKRE
jgi:hypothetical protein